MSDTTPKELAARFGNTPLKTIGAWLFAWLFLALVAGLAGYVWRADARYEDCVQTRIMRRAKHGINSTPSAHEKRVCGSEDQ